MTLKYTGNKSKNYSQIEGGPISLKHVHLNPVSKVAVDQFDIRIRGRIWYSCGKTDASSMFLGVNIPYDYDSLLISVKPQVYLNEAYNIQPTCCF